MNTVRRWVNWQMQKVLPDPGRSFQRIELDRVILDEIVWQADERVLDVGCYRGHYASQLADRGARVTGIDIDPTSMVHSSEDRKSVV